MISQEKGAGLLLGPDDVFVCGLFGFRKKGIDGYGKMPYVGHALVNTKEGVACDLVCAPQGVSSVNADYILEQIKGPPPFFRYVFPHTKNDDVLSLGCGVAHVISEGCVLITDPESKVKFEGQPLLEKRFVIPVSSDLHLDLRTNKITPNGCFMTPRGRGGME